MVGCLPGRAFASSRTRKRRRDHRRRTGSSFSSAWSSLHLFLGFRNHLLVNILLADCYIPDPPLVRYRHRDIASTSSVLLPQRYLITVGIQHLHLQLHHLDMSDRSSCWDTLTSVLNAIARCIEFITVCVKFVFSFLNFIPNGLNFIKRRWRSRRERRIERRK